MRKAIKRRSVNLHEGRKRRAVSTTKIERIEDN